MNVYYFHHQADELLGTASEQFLGKSVKEIKQTILQTLEGHLRAILGKIWVRGLEMFGARWGGVSLLGGGE